MAKYETVSVKIPLELKKKMKEYGIKPAEIVRKAIQEARVEVVLGQYTLSLARYELGNIIWRESVLLRKIPAEGAQELAQQLQRTLHSMEILDIVDEELEVLELAS